MFEPLRRDTSGTHAEAARRSTLLAVEADCRLIIVELELLREAVHEARTRVTAGGLSLHAVMAAYRRAVERGSRLRAMLAQADSRSIEASVASKITQVLECCSALYLEFVRLTCAGFDPGLDMH